MPHSFSYAVSMNLEHSIKEGSHERYTDHFQCFRNIKKIKYPDFQAMTLSPYSNFHPGKFTLEGLDFPTAEHYIQYQKALYFGDSVTANSILKSATALDVKRLSYKIENFNKQQWV